MNKNRAIVTREVTRIIDGDTFIVKQSIDNSNIIRLSGVSTPEKGNKGFIAAKKELEKSIINKTVNIEIIGKSYGRIIGKVKLNNIDINKKMKNFNSKKHFKITNNSKNFINEVMEEDKDLLERLTKM